MKYKFTLLLVILFITLNSFSQVSDKQIDTLFGEKGEIYFKFKQNDLNIDNITTVVSIDNVKDGYIYAYASKKELKALLSNFNIRIEKVRSSGEVDYAEMSNDTKRLREWNVYPTYQAYLSLMNEFASNYPQICKLDTIGVLTSGRILLTARISKDVGIEKDKPKFFYTSSMHGDETTGYILMLRLIDYFLTNYGTNERITNMVDNIDIFINPLANPDGTYAGGNNTVAGATRYNANNVDLNRNYPDPRAGNHPDYNEWQQETVLFMDYANKYNFTMSANIHGGIELCNYPWDTWQKRAADNDWWKIVTRQFADTAQHYGPNGFFTGRENGITNGYDWYSIPGGRQDYMNFFRNCREVTLEISDTKNPPANQLPTFWNSLYRSFLNYMEQSLKGLRGIIKNEQSGEPIAVEVFLQNHDKDNSQVYSNNKVGDYHRLLKSGNYKVKYSAEGYLPVLVDVAVNGSSILRVDTTLWKGGAVSMFSASDTIVKTGDTVWFANLSKGYPTQFNWTFEGANIQTSTQENPFVVYNKVGRYWVKLKATNQLGGDELVKNNYIKVDSNVNVYEVCKINLSIYPNPVNDILNIDFDNENFAIIQIRDLIGRLIIEKQCFTNKNQIYIKNINSGTYFVNVKTKKGNFSEKIIIK